jgi:electron transport complex protein RnfC
VRITPNKAESAAQPVAVMAAPAHCRIPVDLGPAGAARLMVEPGQLVLTGECIARNVDGSCVHASTSGRVTAIGAAAVPGPAGMRATCVDIEADGQDKLHPDCRPPPDYHDMSPEQILGEIAAAGILGLGGAMFPTAAKLATRDPARALIVNGAECEPYISCDERLMRERPGDVIRGTEIMLRALDCEHAVIALESDMPEARVALQEFLEASDSPRIRVAVVTAKYPAGGERQLIELLTGREVPAGGLPQDAGYVCQNVATAAAVAAWFERGQPLISRIVTVTGDCVRQPVNVEARIGTPLADVLAMAGGLKEPPAKLIMGGPMMGYEIAGAELPVTKACNCLLAAAAGELGEALAEYPCIRCGQCSDACPARLLPQMLLGACDRDDTPAMAQLGLDACIECGCCDVVCPSHIPLTATFVRAKQALRVAHTAQAAAERARAASEAHERRLEQIAREQQHALADQDARVADPDAGAAELAALVERSGAREGGNEQH